MDARDSTAASVSLAREADAPATESQVASDPAGQNHIRSQGHIVAIACVVFIVLALVAFAYLASSVVLPVLVACVISMTLKPPVRWLEAIHVPTTLAAAVVVLVVVIAVAFGAMRLGSPALEWIQTAPENVPRLKEKFRHILRSAVRLSEAASSVSTLEPADGGAKKVQPVEVKDNRMTTVFSWTGSLLAGVGETIALVFLLLATGDVFVQKLVRVMPTLRDKKKAVDISHEIQLHISKYLFSVGLINICFGAVVGVALHFLGMPNATMWGGVAALLNFVPYFGPVVGMIGVGLAGLFAFDTFGKALMPAGAYLILHLIEADAVTPFVLGRRFTLNPVIIFVALIFCMWLWGVIGALLAMPLLVIFKVICERVPSLATVGEFLAGQDSVPKNSK